MFHGGVSPLGWLMREKKSSPHWELIGDEPMKPYTVEHSTDAEGFERIAELDGLDFGTHGWSILLPKQETPPYEKPRRPRGRPKKAPVPETARSGVNIGWCAPCSWELRGIFITT